ncbi:carbohydrate ABC transporter membrane protein 1, CUT1 family [Crinalium epipsammum PCC 9333]|uniref:Carbohydrate ABC transporter membrane protein 1, CUT1 family n=1 Tax=Crinalium epipsammum PCC 9333 TaxID=1173022 RepID=K9VXZ5_9CYAN|nr:sugar ABC transporter permease [Crinalium epipsammum]AFZ12836.1 carbohydrate ABC transporter membrane protein 1, CUT1 family [Crinalium epipsammum PCC 9333]
MTFWRSSKTDLVDNQALSQLSLRAASRREGIAAWIFLAPALIFLGTFLLWPIAYLFYLSFTTGSFTLAGVHWVGGKNYLRLLLTPDFWQVITNTVYFTVATVIPSLVISLGLAVLLNRSFALRGLLRTAFFIPSITSLVAAGLGFRWLFQTEGFVNSLLNFFGIESISWLGSTVWAMPVLILLSIWKQLGFNMVVFLAGLQAIPVNRYEAAELDGANSWQQFWHITLPGLKPTLVFVTVTTAIFTLRSFEQVYVITGGGPLNSTNLLVYYIYDQAFAQFDFGYAAAAATVLLAVTLLLVYLQLQVWAKDN